MSEHCELCDETLGDGWCRKCASEANKRSETSETNGAKAFNSALEIIAAKDAEIERLRAGIRRIIEVGAPREVTKPYADDGRPHKCDRCRHDVLTWESCDSCTEDYLLDLLSETPARAPQPTQEPRSGVPGSPTPGKPSGDTR